MNLFPSKPLVSNRHPAVRLVTIVITLLLIVSFGMLRLGDWLTPADPLPEHLDLIVTFAGEQYRVNYSRELMLKYPDAHWFLSDYKNGYSRLLEKNRFDMKRVSVVDTCSNTLAEVRAAAGWIADSIPLEQIPASGSRRPYTIGLISSPYHMRRIDLMAHRYLSSPDLRYVLLPVPLGKYRWEKKTFRYWWRNEFITSITISEFVKIGYFLLTGYL
jgi:uncharacterized SAM-binding protein YcdF (DUF218 family)